MYNDLFTDYEKIFTRIARNSILIVAGEIEASDYWLDRTNVGLKMKERLQADMDPVHADITGFMLLKIDLPNTYE